jgi:hypothetical protein
MIRDRLHRVAHLRVPPLFRVLIALLFWLAGYHVASRRPISQPSTTVSTYGVLQLSERLERERARVTGLRAQLEGLESRAPDTLYIVDTIVMPPDTVFETVTVRDGTLVSSWITRLEEGWSPRISVYTVRGCDEGYSLTGGTVVCDRARAGHLYATAELESGRATLGLAWTRSNDSPWYFTFGYDGGWRVGVLYRKKIF